MKKDFRVVKEVQFESNNKLNLSKTSIDGLLKSINNLETLVHNLKDDTKDCQEGRVTDK